ncbi:MAG: HAMP domain-containing protein [Armatimonadetes bacterium]|nr:HAMP domain-containing protein [Armatimonadota bacterium]
MMQRSIRARLTASYLLLVSACLILVATFVTWRLQVQYMTTYRSVILTQARLISRMLQEYGQEGGTSPARLERMAQEFKWRPEATISVLAESALATMDRAVAPDLYAVAACVARGDRTADCARENMHRDANGQVRIFAAAPVVVPGQPLAIVRVSVPTGWVWVQLRRMIPQLGLGLAIGLVVAWVVGWLLARSLVEPIDELTAGAARISGGDLSQPVRPHGADEIARLGDMFNRMADRLRGMISSLSAERTKLEAIVSGMMDGVVATDREGAVILANQAATELLRAPGASDSGNVTPPLGPRLRTVLAEAATQGRVTAEELPPAEVGNRLVEVHCAPIAGDGGAPIGAVAVLRDVTELRRLERLRRELTANVSHELRTPLTSIKGFAETLLGGAMRDESTCRRFLEIIDKEANRLVKLVDDLLDLSRFEDNRVILDLGQVDVGQLVEETVARLRPLAGSRDFELNAPPEDVIAVADRDRLAQVLTNLLDNAIKFTPDGGRISVIWRCSNGEVEVAVADAGPGIAEQDLPHVFERFYKTDRSRAATPGGGSGLGLAITKHIVEAHGGRIRVSSTPGKGTVFTFTLPRNGD